MSTEFFAAEQSPGNIERHVLTRCESSDEFLAAHDEEGTVRVGGGGDGDGGC